MMIRAPWRRLNPGEIAAYAVVGEAFSATEASSTVQGQSAARRDCLFAYGGYSGTQASGF
jgi:hypothetical protein